MKNLILIMGILLSMNSACAGPIPKGAITSRPNKFGGQTYNMGHGFYRTERNLYGGQNYYNQSGIMELRVYPMPSGGERYQYFGRNK